jgi:hypothetical protein
MAEASEYRLPSGEWRCIRDNVTEPCGDCAGCREIQQINRTGVYDDLHNTPVPVVERLRGAYLEQFVPLVLIARGQLQKAGFDDTLLAVFLPASRDVTVDEKLEGAKLFGLPVHLHLGEHPYVAVQADLS